MSRVGRSPLRKLSPNDRLVSPALQAYDRGLSYTALTRSMAGALLFNVQDDPEAVELQAAIAELGVEAAVTKYTGIAAGHAVHQSVMAEYAKLK
ncbi:Mannitol-1-phosphate 5-dehydrogenase [compost metagenome]